MTTIREVLEQVRELKPSQYSDETMVRWLSELDGRIWEDLICHYGKADEPGPGPYYGECYMDQPLLVGYPHTELYVTYLGAKIDYQNGEFERYNNAMMMFNTQLQAFSDSYNRAHMARQDTYLRV